MSWYRRWFGEEYLELYARRDAGEAAEHAAFVGALLGPAVPARRILDLACGAGRHSEALRRQGERALGVDLSLTLLARGSRLPRAAGDMRCLPFASGAFDWVVNFFTSFGYFEGERENFVVLEEIARVLRPAGGWLIDLFNVDHVLARLEPRATVEISGGRAEIERWYDPDSRRVNKRIRLHAAGRPVREFLESVRAYRRDEVVCAVEWAGLRVTEIYGDFRGSAFDRHSPRLILVGERPP